MAVTEWLRHRQVLGHGQHGRRTTSLPMLKSVGISDSSLFLYGNNVEYGDYTALAFHNNILYPVWADNSNSLHDNPDGALTGSDLHTAQVRLNMDDNGSLLVL